jgi:putative membrane protein
LKVDLKATDVLANERTFLAYVRTALAFVAFGFVIARFSLFAREISIVAHIQISRTGSSAAFGVVMALLGILVGIVGAIRYARAERALREGRVSSLAPKMAYLGAALIAAVGAFVAVDLLSFR